MRGWLRYNWSMVQHKPTNPFYVALLPVGVAFAVTACAYGVMTVRGLDPLHTEDGGVIGVMDRHGLLIMVVELALLGVLTVAAISSDDFWARRFDASQSRGTKTEDNQ
jgi:hypothetical protein